MPQQPHGGMAWVGQRPLSRCGLWPAGAAPRQIPPLLATFLHEREGGSSSFLAYIMPPIHSLPHTHTHTHCYCSSNSSSSSNGNDSSNSSRGEFPSAFSFSTVGLDVRRASLFRGRLLLCESIGNCRKATGGQLKCSIVQMYLIHIRYNKKTFFVNCMFHLRAFIQHDFLLEQEE